MFAVDNYLCGTRPNSMLDDPSLDIIEDFKSTKSLDPRINCLDDIAVLDLSESE